MLTYKEIQELNKDILTIEECEIIHSWGYNIVCNDGEIMRIEKELCYGKIVI